MARGVHGGEGATAAVPSEVGPTADPATAPPVPDPGAAAPADPTPGGPGRPASGEAAALGAVARNGAWGGVGAVVAAVLGFAMTAAIARTAGATDAGTVFAGIALATILLTLATAGADTGLLWALPRDRALHDGRRVRELLRVALLPVTALGLLTGGALWLAAPAVARQIDGDGSGRSLGMLHVLSLAVALGPPLQAALQATRGLGDVRPFVAAQQVGLPLARLLAVLAVAALGTVGPTALGWAWTLPMLAALAATLVVVRRRAPARAAGPRPRLDRALVRTFWSYSVLRGLGAACSMALIWAGVLLVAVLATPAAAGVYAVVSRFATSGQIALQAMRLGVAPQISMAFARGDQERVRLLYGVTTIWAVLLCWPVFVTLAVFAPPLLRLFGAEYVVGEVALAVLSGAMMVSVAVGNVGTLLLMSGRSSWAARNTAAALVTNLVLNVALIPPYGIEGAAIAWTAAIVVENLLGLHVVRRHLHVRGHDRRLAVVGLLVLGLSLGIGVGVRAALGATLPALLLHLCLLGAALLLLVHRRRRDLRLDVLRRRGSAA